MSERLSIRRLQCREDYLAFIACQKRIHREFANAITPLDFMVHNSIHPAKSAFLRQNPSAAWVALQDGVPVGRIMAIENQAYLRRYQNRTGHFGYFESVNDTNVAALLFETAGNWLARRGLTRMIGPFSPSINYETGLLVDGFDRPPAYGMNYAPPYYGQLLEQQGLRPIKDLYSFSVLSADSTTSDLRRRLARRAERTKTLRVRALNMLHYWRDIDLLFDILDDGWRDNWGAVPVSHAERRQYGLLLLPILSRNWLYFVEIDGEAIAVSLQMIPDLNKTIYDLKGRLLPFGWLKMIYRIKKLQAKNSRLLILGVRKKFHNTAIASHASMILIENAMCITNGFKIEEVEVGWILESNLKMLTIVDLFQIKHRKTYRIYGAEFSDGRNLARLL